ncbi:MAG: hypothetical protein SPL08_00615, partial [Pseudomonadota bacterium]|nr:hypothetical protein [Pseudomonadota bacterium]
DKTPLRKILQERDRILAQRQKAWEDGTFDKKAEAKRWAEYLKQRAIDQTLVNYPVYIGEPPFPIDMSILDESDKGTNIQTAASTNAVQPVISTASSSISPDIIMTKATPAQQDLQDLFDAIAEMEHPKQEDKTVSPSQSQNTQAPMVADVQPAEQELFNLLDELENSAKAPQPVVASSDSTSHKMTATNGVPTVQQDLLDLMEGLAEMEQAEKQSSPTALPEPQPSHTPVQVAVTTKPTVEEPASHPVIEKPVSQSVASSKPIVAPVIEPEVHTMQQDLQELLDDVAKMDHSAEIIAPVQDPEQPSHTTMKIVQNDQSATISQPSDVLAELIPSVQQKKTPTPADIQKEGGVNLLPFVVLCVIGVGAIQTSHLRKKHVIKPHTSVPLQPTVTEVPQPESTTDISTDSEATLAITPIRPVAKEASLQDRTDLAEKLHAARLMEDIKRERSQLTRQMARAKANNDTQKMAEIRERRQVLTALRKNAFKTLAGPLLDEIKEKRRLLTKQMTLARRKKEEQTIFQITQQREQLTSHEKALKAMVRSFKYRSERASFLSPKILARKDAALKHQPQHTRV